MSLTAHQIECIREIQSELQMQPVLFIGSGFTRRYFNGPNWSGLLQGVLKKIGYEKDIAYLVSKHGGRLASVATELVEPAFEWAWEKGSNHFSAGLLGSFTSKAEPLKHIACTVLREQMTAKPSTELLADELRKFSDIRPQAIITTNYDERIEQAFDGYCTIVGRDVYRYRINAIGEIYKIHGTISDPSSIILTDEDYQGYEEKRRYISAKMIAMFAENPVFIFGYSLNDPNVAKIICDVGEVIADNDGFVSNIFFIEWRTDAARQNLPETMTISSAGRSYSIRRLSVPDFGALLEILAEPASLTGVQPHLLRAVIARVGDAVRVDIPRRQLEVTYDDLERNLRDDATIPKLLGFSVSDNSNTTHPYTITQIAHQLGFNSHNQITNGVIRPLKSKYGFDIQASDNSFHQCIKVGMAAKSKSHKYSKRFVEVAKAVLSGADISVDPARQQISIVG